jgi:hypothetical protein
MEFQSWRLSREQQHRNSPEELRTAQLHVGPEAGDMPPPIGLAVEHVELKLDLGSRSDAEPA